MCGQNSNTTNVKVKLCMAICAGIMRIDSNTTNVKVKRCGVAGADFGLLHSNTTNVKVKLNRAEASRNVFCAIQIQPMLRLNGHSAL